MQYSPEFHGFIIEDGLPPDVQRAIFSLNGMNAVQLRKRAQQVQDWWQFDRIVYGVETAERRRRLRLDWGNRVVADRAVPNAIQDASGYSPGINNPGPGFNSRKLAALEAIRNGYPVPQNWLVEDFEVFAHNKPQKEENVAEINVDKLEWIKPERSVELAPFMMHYENQEEISRRWRRTILNVKGHPFNVLEVRVDAKGVPFFVVAQTGDELGKKLYLNKIPDFRSFEPGYVQYNNEAMYLIRHPNRVFQQGLNADNTSLRRCGSNENVGWNTYGLIAALKERTKKFPWKQQMLATLDTGAAKSLRLSNHVAVFKPAGAKNPGIKVEYKGRPLGILITSPLGSFVKVLDPEDLEPTWIVNDLRSVGLEMRS